MKRQIAVASLGLFAVCALAACGQGDGPAGPEGDAAAEASAAAEAAAASYSYEVRLVLSPDAAQRLAGLGEEVTISADYYGLAREGSAAAKAAEAHGEVMLAQEQVSIEPVDQLVRIVSPLIEPKAMKDVDGEAMLLVNVYTSRKVAADNLINCGIYDGSLAVATVRPILIECGLIDAGAATTVAAP